jgi:hypothetical protein
MLSALPHTMDNLEYVQVVRTGCSVKAATEMKKLTELIGSKNGLYLDHPNDWKKLGVLTVNVTEHAALNVVDYM